MRFNEILRDNARYYLCFLGNHRVRPLTAMSRPRPCIVEACRCGLVYAAHQVDEYGAEGVTDYDSGARG